jgi:hypothetical protein
VLLYRAPGRASDISGYPYFLAFDQLQLVSESPLADNYEDRYFNRGCHGLGAERFCTLHLPAAQRWIDQVPGVAVHSTELKLQLSCHWYDSTLSD